MEKSTGTEKPVLAQALWMSCRASWSYWEQLGEGAINYEGDTQLWSVCSNPSPCSHYPCPLLPPCGSSKFKGQLLFSALLSHL